MLGMQMTLEICTAQIARRSSPHPGSDLPLRPARDPLHVLTGPDGQSCTEEASSNTRLTCPSRVDAPCLRIPYLETSIFPNFHLELNSLLYRHSGPPLRPHRHRPRRQDESMVMHPFIDSASGCMDFSLHQLDRKCRHPA